MDRWVKFLLLSTLISSQAYAEKEVPYSLIADACLKEKNIDFCKQLGITKDNAEHAINRQLAALGILNATILFGSLLRVGVERKFELQDRSNISWIPGEERRYIVTEGQAMIMFVWPLD